MMKYQFLNLSSYKVLLFIFLTTAFSCSDDEPGLILPTNGLVAHYPLDGTAEDLSGNNLDGSINGALSAANRNNQQNTSLEFNGSDSNVDLGDILDDTFTGTDKNFSFSFWIYPNSALSNNLILSKLGDSDCEQDQRQFTVRVVDNKINALFYYNLFPTAFRRWQGETTLELNTWYHIVVNYDGSIVTNDGAERLSIVIDGNLENMTLDGSDGPLGDFQDGEAHLGIGNRLDSNGDNCGTGRVFNGRIDDLRIYNRILLSDEIESLRME